GIRPRVRRPFKENRVRQLSGVDEYSLNLQANRCAGWQRFANLQLGRYSSARVPSVDLRYLPIKVVGVSDLHSVDLANADLAASVDKTRKHHLGWLDRGDSTSRHLA